MEDELDDIAWELGCPVTRFIERFKMARESTVSMFCFIHKEWKHNVDNPICLYCENERYKVENDELKRAIKVLQSKG